MAQNIAVFPLSSPLLPGGRLPLRVFETRYIDLMRRNMKGEQAFAIGLLASGGEVAQMGAKPAKAHPIATLAEVVDFQQGNDGCLQLLLQGMQKVQLSAFDVQADRLMTAKASIIQELPSQAELESLVLDPLALEQLEDIAQQLLAHPALQGLQLSWPLAPCALAALLAQYLPFEPQVKYSLLKLDNSEQRLNKIVTLIEELS